MLTRVRALSFLLTAILLAPAVTASSALTAPEKSLLGRSDAANAARLGSAVTALSASGGDDPALARRTLLTQENDFALLQDYVLYFLARSRLAATGLSAEAAADEKAAAAAELEKLLALAPDSPVAPASAALLVGLPETADARVLELAEKYRGGITLNADFAAIALEAARRLQASDPRRSLELANRARARDPGGQSGRPAAELASDLQSDNPKLLPTSADQLVAETRLLGAEGRHSQRVAMLDKLLKDFPRHPSRTTSILDRARSTAALKDKQWAAWWLSQKSAGESDPGRSARLLYESAVYSWNANQSTLALQRFEKFLSLGSGLDEEHKAHYASGRIHESARRYNSAAAHYRSAEKSPDQHIRSESAWRAGWASYRAGNYTGAAWKFGLIVQATKPPARGSGVSRPSSPSGRESALYWKARSIERAAGKTSDEALHVYRQLLAEFPDGFYSWLVEQRLPLRAPAASVETLPRSTATLDASARRTLARAEALRIAGLGHHGATETARLTSGRSSEQLLALLPQLAASGAWNSSLRVALQLYRKGLLNDAQLYPFLYPRAHADIVVREAGRWKIRPSLVYALMKQESVFDAHATSPAAAYGLMQLLLPTARRVAKTTDRAEPSRDDLFVPDVNIALGTAYLASLARRFNDNPVLMLAGYNAGENAAQRWLDRLDGLDEDEFIERISYRETRGYVKKVLRNARNFERVYGSSGDSAAGK